MVATTTNGDVALAAANAVQPTATSAGSDEVAKLGARLVRETAIVLAGVTAVFYLASHIYGRAYLQRMGIDKGFQGVGFGNLAMMSPLDVILAVLLTVTTYYVVIDGQRSIWTAVGIFTATTLVCFPWTEGDQKGIPYQWDDIVMASAFMLASFGWAFLRRRKQFDRRRARAKIFLACATITALFYIPGLADLDVIMTLENGQHRAWYGPSGNDQRYPVYWVGDHIVYLTNDKNGCFSHILIGPSEVAKRVCTPMMKTFLDK